MSLFLDSLKESALRDVQGKMGQSIPILLKTMEATYQILNWDRYEEDRIQANEILMLYVKQMETILKESLPV